MKLKKLFCITLIAFVVAIALVGCDMNSGNEDDATRKLSYVAIRINPEIELILKDEIVVGVHAENEDGEIVLFELNLNGLNIDEACEIITQKATELGYIDVDSTDVVVNIEVNGEDDDINNKIKEKIEKKVNDFFNNNGIYGYVKHENYEKHLELIVLAKEWGVDVHDAKLIYRILELYPDKTLEEVIELSTSEKIHLIQESDSHINHNYKLEYMEEVKQLKEKYEDMFVLKRDICEIKKQLSSEDLTDEERSNLENTLSEKEAEFDILYDAFIDELEQIKSKYEQFSESYKNRFGEIIKERKEQYKNKLENHYEEVAKYKEEIEEKINQWRRNLNS